MPRGTFDEGRASDRAACGWVSLRLGARKIFHVKLTVAAKVNDLLPAQIYDVARSSRVHDVVQELPVFARPGLTVADGRYDFRDCEVLPDSFDWKVDFLYQRRSIRHIECFFKTHQIGAIRFNTFRRQGANHIGEGECSRE